MTSGTAAIFVLFLILAVKVIIMAGTIQNLSINQSALNDRVERLKHQVAQAGHLSFDTKERLWSAALKHELDLRMKEDD